MHHTRAFAFPLSLLLVSIGTHAASAQVADNGQVQIVNPKANGSGILLYPGGTYGRIDQPLLQPGDPYPGTKEKPIHLHMPARHIAKRVTPATTVASTAPATTTPPPAPVDTSPPTASVTDSTVSLVPTEPAPPKHTPPAKPPTPKAPAQTAQAPANAEQESGQFFLGGSQETLTPQVAPTAPPTRTASVQPPPQTTPHQSAPTSPGMARQGTIVFAPGIADPNPDAIDAIKGLASPLNSVLAANGGRVEIVAYAGPHGDKTSDSRRLSLKRAIVIRQLLIDGGVPSERIDVHAMGGANDANGNERVDVFTKS